MISLFICCICRPEVREIDIFKVLKGEFREAEVGVDDRPGAGRYVGEDHGVGGGVAGVLRTSLHLHPVLLQPLPQPDTLRTGGEGAQVPRPQSKVREDGAAVVGVAAPALKCQVRHLSRTPLTSNLVLVEAPLVGVLLGELADDGHLVQTHQPSTQHGLYLHPWSPTCQQDRNWISKFVVRTSLHEDDLQSQCSVQHALSLLCKINRHKNNFQILYFMFRIW